MRNVAYFRNLNGTEEDLPRSRFYAGVPKRALDLLIVIACLPFALPLIGVVWVLVRLDGGSGFFRQERVGMQGRRFRLLKLRTMVPDADAALQAHFRRNPAAAQEWETRQKLTHDPRITPVGRFLRKTSLDELPQLLNVLRGDMSIVGPRPFMSDQEARYVEGGGRCYYRMRPGITGLWQVTDRNGEAFLHRVQCDNQYFRSLSLRQDLSILMRTVAVLARTNGQ